MMITKNIKNSLIACLVGCGCATVISCTEFSDYNEARTDAQASGNQTLWENIRQNSQLSEFAALIQKSGFDKELSQTQYYTVWAPLNNTFDAASLTERKSASRFLSGSATVTSGVTAATFRNPSFIFLLFSLPFASPVPQRAPAVHTPLLLRRKTHGVLHQTGSQMAVLLV